MKKILHILSRPIILFYSLPWLLGILLAGTLAQRSMGLYEAEKTFFSSFIIWIDGIPIPGMYAVLALMGISLIAKLILKSPWTRATSGTVITHLGALLLLFGAMLTAFTSEEGSITLDEGEQTNIISDYHAREFVILKNEIPLLSIPHTSVIEGQSITHPQLPFSLTILKSCQHCEPSERRYVSQEHRGIAEKIQINPATPKKEDEQNQFGVTFRVAGVDETKDGIYLAFEIAQHQPMVQVGKDNYHIMARKIQRELPFEVRLESFEKYSYPGSSIAEEYESIVSIIDGDLE